MFNNDALQLSKIEFTKVKIIKTQAGRGPRRGEPYGVSKC